MANVQNVSVNYSGRMVDLLIFQGTKPTGEQRITLGFGDVGGEITTGIQKLAQMFTTLFLTETGSIPSQPNRGTGFVTAVRFGRIKDEQSVQAEFSLAAEAVRSQLALAEEEAVNVPADESLSSSILANYTLDKNSGNLILYVDITSNAGTSKTIYLPVPVPIR